MPRLRSWGKRRWPRPATVPKKDRVPRILVLAGTNGAGKSSIGGAMLTECGVEYFDPDDAAVEIRNADPSLSQEGAQSIAWRHSRRLLERAIAERLDYAFETTLGGNTIPALLRQAAESGIEVRIWYVGLDSPERHLARVRARVSRGGHDIPEQRIREHYARSLLNLIGLLPQLAELRVYDNTREADPHTGVAPEPVLLLHLDHGRLRTLCDLASAPQWAKPVLITALQEARG